MLAYVLDETPGLKQVPEPELGPGEVLVKVLLAGICGTDLEILAGYRNFRGIPGHEMVGTVERAPDPEWVGARVVSEINIACGTCSLCARGLPRHCRARQVLGIDGRAGAFAEFLAMPLENLHRVPDNVADEESVWAEPLAAALAVWDAGIQPGENVLVLGDGRLGALIALSLRERGAQVKVAGKHPDKISLLRSLGIDVLEAGPQPVYPWVVEATGSPKGIEMARAWTRPRGTIILKSTSHEAAQIDVSRIVVDEIRVVGSRCGDFPPALEALASKAIPVQRLISKIYPFREIETALDKSSSPSVFKNLLDFRKP
jgi:threonine dehydrogenase-like Zn-dependent dehydrogenase